MRIWRTFYFACFINLVIMHCGFIVVCQRFVTVTVTVTVTDLVLRLACLSNVKVVFWHVSGRINSQVSASGYKLVTRHVV